MLPDERGGSSDEAGGSPGFSAVGREFYFVDLGGGVTRGQSVAADKRLAGLYSRTGGGGTDGGVDREFVDRLGGGCFVLGVGLNNFVGLGHVVVRRRFVAE